MATGGRLGVDIGGTFTDVALELGDQRWSAKILTTPEAPERAVIEVIHQVLGEAGLAPADLSIIIHGTTLATNAIIERKGARTALVTTEGFRDTIEIRHENRFEQYDVKISTCRRPWCRAGCAFRCASASTRRAGCWCRSTRPGLPTSPAVSPSTASKRRGRLSAQLYQSRARAPRRRYPGPSPAMSRSPCRPTCRRRCASTSAFRPPAPMPMSSR